MEQISASLEDYLEGIYFLREKNEFVRVADLAELMNVKKPSVVKSLIRLKEKGLIVQEPYGKVELTPAGDRLAADVAQRHKTLRNFLSKILFVDADIAEDDACRIEHMIHPQTFKNLTKFIEFMGLEGTQKTPEWLKKFRQFLKTGKRNCSKNGK